MSALLKWFALACAMSAVLAITSVRDDAVWFKNSNRLKDKFNGIFETNCEEPSNGALVQGQCMNKHECMRREGKVGSPCSLLGVCCVIEKTCNQTTSAKLSYFTNFNKFESDCPLTINVLNSDVCQIRLDFEEFDIAQPTTQETQEGGVMTVSSYQCRTDMFKVEGITRNLGFTALCGSNRGQHIYIPVDENQNQITLRFNMEARNPGDNLPDPRWRIKIRQLECKKGFLQQQPNASSKLMALYQSLKNKKHHQKSDYDLIAPPNCLQYYSEKSGKFESFNYNNGNGFYIGPMNYAICFRKTPDSCAIRYTNEGPFNMNYNPLVAGVPLDDRCHPRPTASRTVSQDYIRIHGGITSVNEFKDYFCDTDFNPQSSTITSKSVEPYFIGVNTDAYLANGEMGNPHRLDFQEIGFRLSYELDSINCN